MVRRREFLTKFKSKNFLAIKNEIIRDNLYYNDKISGFSFNKRFFWKKITHLNKYFNLLTLLRNYAFVYKSIKINLYNYYFCLSSFFSMIFFYKINNHFFHKIKRFFKLMSKFKKNNLVLPNTNNLNKMLFSMQLKSFINTKNLLTLLLLKNLYNLFLEKKILFNNGIHSSYNLVRSLPLNIKISIFNFFKNPNKNKNNFSIKLSRSAQPVKKKIIFKKISSKNTILLKFLVQFVLNSFNNKIISLFCCSNGVFFFSFSTSLHYLFKFYKNINLVHTKKYKFKKDMIFLFKLKRLDNFCSFNFSFNKKKQYATAIGSKAFLIKIDKASGTGVIKMPSKKKKIISLYTFVFKGRIKCFSNKKLVYTKAGYLRLRGKKANSRGVSMNPVDHPHGGNTNSIKLHRTPWGLPTKKKKYV